LTFAARHFNSLASPYRNVVVLQARPFVEILRKKRETKMSGLFPDEL
jgi:hypothetical protein